MPVALSSVTFCCDVCGENKPRNKFSAIDGICLDCFDRYYYLCAGCGNLLRRNGTAVLRRRYNAIALMRDGGAYCHNCYYRIFENNGHTLTWPPTPFGVSCATYDKIGSTRKYGVEIETASCSGHPNLAGHTIFGCKVDCSITGMEFDSPILYGDEGLDAISDFLDKAAENCWTAYSDCGCHTHYDMRGESFEQLGSVAYAYRVTQQLWKSLVPRRRRRGTYSHEAEWTSADFRDAFDRANNANHPGLVDKFYGLCSRLRCERYEMVNLTAYGDHMTFEVRSLEGTCDAELIRTWITLHTRFIDLVRNLSFDEIDELFVGRGRAQRAALAGMLDDANLATWMEQRASSVEP